MFVGHQGFAATTAMKVKAVSASANHSHEGEIDFKEASPRPVIIQAQPERERKLPEGF